MGGAIVVWGLRALPASMALVAQLGPTISATAKRIRSTISSTSSAAL